MNTHGCITFYLPSLAGGGAERVMVLLANWFGDQGKDVELVLAKATGPYLADVNSGVTIVDLKSSRVGTSLPALVRYIRKARPSTIISALNHSNLVALAANVLAGRPAKVIVTQHSNFSASRAQKLPVSSKIVLSSSLFGYRFADAIVGVSDGVSKDLARCMRLPDSRIKTIRNPVITDKLLDLATLNDNHAWVHDSEPPFFLSVGRLTLAKDFANLLKAFAVARARRPCRLVILGEGELRAELEQLTHELKIVDDVLMPGFVSNPFPWFANCAAFVLSSAWEGLSQVVIEALACGAKVVSTDCPSGPREILEDGKWGRLVPVRAPNKLAEAMLASLDDAPNPGARERGLQFTVNRAANQYLALIKSL